MRITSGGLVGIGNSSPAEAKLCVNGGISIEGVYSSYKANIFTMDNNGGSSRLNSFGPNITTPGSFDFAGYSSNASVGTTRMFISSAGLVGIGSSNPQALLHISSATTATERISGTAGNSDNTECANIDFQNNTSGSVVGRIRSLTGVGGIQSGKGQLAFFAHNGTSLLERVRINEDGLVGIGSTVPNEKLTVADSGSANVYIALQNSTTGTTSADGWYLGAAGTEFQIYGKENGPITFSLNSSEKARIDTSGRLLVGTSTARSSINILNQTDLTPSVQFEGQSTSNRSTGLSIINYSASDFGAAFTLGASNSNILGTNTLVESDGDVGVINFVGADGTRFVSCASIASYVDGTPGANDMPGRLVFSTTPDGGSSPTSSPPAMTIKSSQEVLIGTSTITANGGILQLKSGITFPATPVAATDPNTLDDYEEGTWVPTFLGSTTNPTQLYNLQLGRYVRIGNQVSITCRLLMLFPGVTGGTGDLSIGGLPFPSANITNQFWGIAVSASSLSTPATGGIISNNSSEIALYQLNNFTAVSATVVDSSSVICITGWYQV
jgi:hypothetical protein